ncbi:MAG TPA: M1 family metallopeptidase, partial [Acidimicrobiales bacterium]|nr:M1 family metallopeptidase [Acidimicrobiales bacterium]
SLRPMTETTLSGLDDPSARHRLPYAVEPRRYALRLAPDLEQASFTGEVHIEVQVHEAVRDIVLHAAELTVHSAALEPAGGERRALAVRVDEGAERLILSAEAPLAPGPAVISVDFAGILNDQLHGFYRATFTDDDGVLRTIATTQFEATDARRAFPCFDEPDRKAVFSITLDVPEGLAAYSNGPEVDASPLAQGGQRIRFGDTIAMSTYLVAFVVGPLVTSAPVVVRGTPVRIVHVPGKAELTAYALEAAGHALEFFSDWFGIDYPAEKLDLLAIPDFAFGAMENLGCVTFREALLLVDPLRASRLELERVADVISHEIAHMWFGDLVTMRWWNGIWLNEAFATLMELLCVDHFRPEWQRWVSFGVERDAAMATDGLHSTRPVEYAVGPPEEAQGMFDVLTYQKGAGVLRMLERYLGAERFRQGVRRYLEAHQFGNTETADLWDAIEEASGEPVRDIMDSWILQGGFPLVTVSGSEGDGGSTGPERTVTLGQGAFEYASTDATSAIGSAWTVPIIARTIGAEDETRVLLGTDPTPLAVGNEADAAVVVNAHGTGYYRVRYTPALHRRLAGRLDALDLLERFNLLADTWAVVVAQQAGPEDFLLLAEALGSEDDPDVWAQVTGALSLLDRATDEEARPLVASYTRALLNPVLARLSWDGRPGEDPRTSTLRAQAVGALGTFGHDTDVHAEAHRRHDAAQRGELVLEPDVASAVLSAVAASGGPDDYDVFLEHYRHPATPQEEMRYLNALAGFPDPTLAARTFEFARTEVRSQNAPFVIHGLLANRDTGPATWARVRDHWPELVARIPANILPRMLGGIASLCRDPELAADVTAFVRAHPLPVGQRTVDQTLERLEINLAFATALRISAAPVLRAALQRMDAR